MAKKRTVRNHRAVPAERRVDVTRVEFQHLLDMVERNAEAILRLQQADAIQLRRTAEIQGELTELLKRPTIRK
jgi:hypothetical protein